MSRGEIRWAPVPGAGVRPVLILTRDVGLPLLSRALVAPVTRTVRGIPTELALDESDGMPEPCVASFDNVTALDKETIGALIAVLGPARMAEACRALRFATGC